MNLTADAIKGLLGGVLQPISDLITNKEEKAQAVALIKKAEDQVSLAIVEMVKSEIRVQRDIIVSEAQSESALTRMWRPIAMLTFVSLIPASYLTVLLGGNPEAIGMALTAIPPDAWGVIKIGLGGYVALRSVDKWVKQSNGSGLKGSLAAILLGKKERKALLQDDDRG